jgi:hypothetical protein
MRWEGQECVRIKTPFSMASASQSARRRRALERPGETPRQTNRKAAASGHLPIMGPLRSPCITGESSKRVSRGLGRSATGQISHAADSTVPCKRGTFRATGWSYPGRCPRSRARRPRGIRKHEGEFASPCKPPRAAEPSLIGFANRSPDLARNKKTCILVLPALD